MFPLNAYIEKNPDALLKDIAAKFNGSVDILPTPKGLIITHKLIEKNIRKSS